MANDLTGDFDLVAEFSLAAANRVLAAMHASERFLHSISLRVDDTPKPDLHGGVVPTSVAAAIDAFGDPIVNHNRFRNVAAVVGDDSSSNLLTSALDAVVNFTVVSIDIPPIVPSHLKGRAQLQLFPPTLFVPDSSGTRLTVRLGAIARYFPDPDTAPLAEFVQGDLQITAPIDQVASQAGRVLEIDVKADSAQIEFSPTFSSRLLSVEDRAAIDLVMRNALKTAFLPSNATLPSSIGHIQFKTMAGSPDAVAILLNMGGAAGHPATAHNVFLGAGDQFAFAAGVDFVRATFQPTLDNILSTPVDPVKFDIDTWVHTFHITYTVTLKSATIDLENGAIVLTIKGHAHTGTSWLPDFDFTVRQKFGLSPDGATANLVVGDLSFDTSSFIVGQFKGAAIPSIARARDLALQKADAASMVRHKLSADENLGQFLRSLFDPPRKQRAPQAPGFSLAYTSIDVVPSGIVLHGSLAVPDFPPAHVEYEEIPGNSLLQDNTIFGQPEYSALKSWIPGGTIERYEWARFRQPNPVVVETHKFIFQGAPPVADGGSGAAAAAISVSGYNPLCLTIRGSRISSAGPIALQPISSTSCGFDSFPIVGDAQVAFGAALPTIALTLAGAGGLVEIAGHAIARSDPGNTFNPNLIVHFADDRSAEHLPLLIDALYASGRRDAATAVVAVLTPDQLTKTHHTDGIVYSDDHDGWTRLLGRAAIRRPTTLIVKPKGGVAFGHEGPIDRPALARALKEYLVARKALPAAVTASGVRVGQPPPNMLFEHAPGRALTLRKLAGRPAALVFWKSASRPSIDAARALAGRSADPRGGPPPVVLAINDGDPAGLATKIAAGNGLTASLVLDPDRAISRAYGVEVWPTIVDVDPRGLVTRINVGHDAAHHRDGEYR